MGNYNFRWSPLWFRRSGGIMSEKRTHHYSASFHWSHFGACQKVCSDWYPNSQVGECSGQQCDVLRAWKKEDK